MGYAGRYFRRYHPGFVAAVACLAVESVCDLAQPALMARVLDEGVGRGDVSVVLRLGLCMLAVAAVGALGAAGRNVAASLVSFRFAADLRRDLYAAIVSMPAAVAGRFDPSSLVTRQTNDVTQVQHFANGMMRIFAKAPIVALGSLGMAFALEPRLALVPTAVVAVAGGILVLYLRIGMPLYAKVQTGTDAVNASARGFLGGIRVVKAFGRFADEEARFDEVNTALADSGRVAAQTSAAFGPATTLAANLGIAAILWIGGYRTGAIPVGRVVAFISYMTQILHALGIMTNVFSWLARAKASHARIAEILDAEPGAGVPAAADRAAYPASAAASSAGAAGPLSLAFSDVGFSYPGAAAPSLRGLSFECEPGGITAVIGSTGAGKTALTRLIARFHDPDGGAVLFDGRDIRNMPPAEARAMVALAPQAPSLFTGTVLDNIGWGADGATEALAAEAARLAQVADFIDGLPERYDTMLGRGGINLSGGQRQRISLARALARVLSRDRTILVLDDCTSAVDALTEARIREGIRSLGTRATTLWITQRVVTAMRADRVLVLGLRPSRRAGRSLRCLPRHTRLPTGRRR